MFNWYKESQQYGLWGQEMAREVPDASMNPKPLFNVEAIPDRSTDVQSISNRSKPLWYTGDLADDLFSYSKNEGTFAEVLKYYGAEWDVIKFDTGVDPIFVIWYNGEQYVATEFNEPMLTEATEWVTELQNPGYYLTVIDYNIDFWNDPPAKLYHGTYKEKIADIKKMGLLPRSDTRGLSNRNTGDAVFTSTSLDTAEHFYDIVVEIDILGMVRDGYTVNVSREEPVEEASLYEALAHKIGIEDFYYETEDSLDPETVIFYGVIPPKYLQVAGEETKNKRSFSAAKINIFKLSQLEFQFLPKSLKEPWEMTKSEWLRSAKTVLYPAIYASGKIYTGNHHGEAVKKALDEGALVIQNGILVDAKNGDDFGYSGAGDLFVTTDGKVIDRLTADSLYNVPASEYLENRFDPHRQAIVQALNENKPVPEKVLEEYPDLRKSEQLEPSFSTASFSAKTKVFKLGQEDSIFVREAGENIAVPEKKMSGPNQQSVQESVQETVQEPVQKKPWDMDENELTNFFDDNVAQFQRGDPEHAMLQSQYALGGGVMSYALEHIGDLIHRMSEKPTAFNGGYEAVSEKVRKMINILSHEYGFSKEHKENMENNARYYLNKGSIKSKQEYYDRVAKALQRYVAEHKKIRPYNEVQKLANEAAIAIGELRVDDALNILITLQKYLDEGAKAWRARTRMVDRPEQKSASTIKFYKLAQSDPWATTRKDYYNNFFIGGDTVNIPIIDDISDYETLEYLLPQLQDGYYVVGVGDVVQVNDHKATTVRDLHANFDYKTSKYTVVRRKNINERPVYFHGTRGKVDRATDLKAGTDYGPLGENEYRAIYMTQDPNDAYSFKWGDDSKVISLRLKNDVRLANHQEAFEARKKHPEMEPEEAIKAEGYVGVGKKNRRGDYFEIALFDANAIEEYDPHKDLVEKALQERKTVPSQVLADYPEFSGFSRKIAQIQSSKLIGYKIVGWNEKQAYSLYDKSIYDVRPGSVHNNIFIGTSEEFAKDYYRGLTDDNDMLVVYEYEPADILSGGGQNSEVKVRKATVREARLI